MKILHDPQILSGYVVEQPFAKLPAVTHCGEAVCVRGHHLADHSHSGFEFLVLTRGRVSWVIDGLEIDQEIGEVVVTFPRQVHRTGRRPNPENQHLWIGLDLDRLSRSGKRLATALRRRNLHVLPAGPELESLLRGLIAQSVSGRSRGSDIARCYLETFIAIFLQEIEEPHSKLQPELVPYSLPIQRCLAYMERHVDRRLPLGDLARVAAIQSVSYFCTRFRREVGMTPAETHLRMRLDGAREALARPGAEVTEIAMQYGFSSSQHFSGKFKAAFGLSPSSWRRKVAATERA